MASETELLRRAIAIGEELVRISDSVHQPLASVHIATGLDILRAHADLRDALEAVPSPRDAHDRPETGAGKEAREVAGWWPAQGS